MNKNSNGSNDNRERCILRCRVHLENPTENNYNNMSYQRCNYIVCWLVLLSPLLQILSHIHGVYVTMTVAALRI